MARFEGESFEDRQVRLDGNEYRRCVFRRCKLQFGAMEPVTAVDCSFEECDWMFTGAAALTVGFMTALYQAGAKQLIERTFENIRHGRHPGAD